MSDTLIKKPQRAQTSLVLSAPVRGALRRIKKNTGWSKRRTFELAVLELDARLANENHQGGRTI